VVTLSVVIPATDGRVTLERVVAAVRRASAGPEELIVVEQPRNLGPAAARNLASRQASGDILVFIDADVEVHEDVFVRIRRAFDDDADLAAVFGSYDDEPGPAGIVSDFRNLLHHHVHQQNAGVATTFWAGLGSIRRDVFHDLGGFDEARFPLPSVEDIELGMRLDSQGERILLDPGIQGKHLKEWTLENRSGGTTLNLGWPHRIATASSVLLLVALLRRKPWLVGSSLVVLIVLDGKFYGLLFRRGGARLLAAGVPLHVVHRLTSAAAVPITLTGLLLEKWKLRKRA